MNSEPQSFDNRGFFDSLRASHPLKCGDMLDGKKIVGTCYQIRDGESVAMVRLEGESEYRPA